MHKVCFILGDQLSLDLASLKAIDKKTDIVVMAEVSEEGKYVPHHKKKIAFLLSAMRHFAETLIQEGYHVQYFKLGENSGLNSFTDVAKHVIKETKAQKIVVTHPGEYRVLKHLQAWCEFCECEILEDDRFLCSIDEFKLWAGDKTQLRMEFFYRQMRQKHHILMDGNQPVCGKWNFDADNRKKPPADLNIPEPLFFEIDDISKEAIETTEKHFSNHFGDMEPFYFAVTKKQAEAVLERFIDERLPRFGDFQDGMLEGQPWMFHAHISFYLNCGLLDPMTCIRAAESAYYEGHAPINAVEGFIRQVLGWREYIRGIYWLKMPHYATENFLEVTRPLPEFYWTADTKMNCIKQCVTETKQNAYAHHIQRLMVLGNFLLLIGVHPDEVNEWYLSVYADAYEWVEMPNVTGMILFADGGFLASKPYAAGGAYINKMSNYCKNCVYKVTEKTGESACPFNYLYWDFLIRNQDKLGSNQRLSMMYRQLQKMSPEKLRAIQDSSRQFLESL